MKPSTVPQSIGPAIWLAVGLLLATFVFMPGTPAQSREGDRTLRLYHLHTGEKAEFTFKRGGQFDRAELLRLNRFLRDWRKEQPITMDPRLFDLIWSIYRETGSNGYISVVCGYRTVGTNDMLRSRGRGVASHSQHSLGKAMDFFIPGVPLAKLRAIAMKFQGGGVGYYPTSGSPFVHVDTGNVRMWPRMTRQQLLAVFPAGDTLYLPADGKPLQGYQRALARAGSMRSGNTALAYLDAGSDDGDGGGGGGGGGWLKRVFGGGRSQDRTSGETAVASAAPVQAPVVVAKAAPRVAVPAAAEPAEAEPSTFDVAAAEAPAEPRLPKARPANADEVEVAAASPAETAAQPAEPVAAPEESVASLAFAPLPRTRPDPTLLVDSLQARAAPAALSVAAEDALAALASHADEETPAAAVAATAPAPVQLAYAEPDASTAQAAGTVAEVAQRPVPLPRPRPLALASVDAGMALPQISAALPRKQESPASAHEARLVSLAPADRPGKGDRLTVRLSAPQSVAAARFEVVAGLDQQAGFTGFAMPQPAGVTALFRVPGTASEVATAASTRPALPTGRFASAEGNPAPGDQSLFSRLFASLTD